jgi:hypothetical protein
MINSTTSRKERHHLVAQLPIGHACAGLFVNQIDQHTQQTVGRRGGGTLMRDDAIHVDSYRMNCNVFLFDKTMPA